MLLAVGLIGTRFGTLDLIEIILESEVTRTEIFAHRERDGVVTAQNEYVSLPFDDQVVHYVA